MAFAADRLASADDRALVLAQATGERDAAPAVVARYAPLVTRVVRRLLGPGDDVDDVAQETFFAVFRNLSRLREPSAFKAYLVSVAIQTARSERRRRWLRRRREVMPGDARSAGVALATVSVDTDAREALARLYAILQRLRAPDRDAYALRFIEGMTIDEVARALGVSTATVKRRVARARGKVALLARRVSGPAALRDALSGQPMLFG